MPEDQGVNGDIWNNEARLLLSKLGWIPVGDTNIDLLNNKNKKKGIDSLCMFKDPIKNQTLSQGVLVEAKRYLTTSFTISALREWIKVCNEKIASIRNSPNLSKSFPKMSQAVFTYGLIVIWISDTKKYEEFKKKLDADIINIKIPKNKNTGLNKVFVMHNDNILRLSSVVSKIESLTTKKSTFNFYYPASNYYTNSIAKSDILTINYMFSKIIMGELKSGNKTHKYVFYFGQISVQAFYRLSSFLLESGFTEKEKPLTIFKYLRDDEFRKHKQDVLEIFHKLTSQTIIEDMDHFADLPSFLKDLKDA